MQEKKNVLPVKKEPTPQEIFEAEMLDIEGQDPNRQVLRYGRLTCKLLMYLAFKK